MHIRTYDGGLLDLNEVTSWRIATSMKASDQDLFFLEAEVIQHGTSPRRYRIASSAFKNEVMDALDTIFDRAHTLSRQYDGGSGPRFIIIDWRASA